VDAAADGEEGAMLAQVNDYDVAILDLMLPGPGWPDAARQMAAQRESDAGPAPDCAGMASKIGCAGSHLVRTIIW